LTLKGLESARGYLQSKIADRLQSRNTPVLSFVIDRGVKSSIETSRILREELGRIGDAQEASSGNAADDEPDIDLSAEEE